MAFNPQDLIGKIGHDLSVARRIHNKLQDEAKTVEDPEYFKRRYPTLQHLVGK